MPSMDKITDIIAQVEEYAAQAGLSASTVCGYATGNKRLLDRLKRRAERTINDIARLEQFMAANPPAASGNGDSR